MHDKPSLQVQNALLADLAFDEWRQLQPRLEQVVLAPQMVLHGSGTTFKYVYFPLSGAVSHLIAFSDGFSVEMAQVGKEGIIGISLVLGGSKTTTRAVVQLAGWALRIQADVLRDRISDMPDLHKRLLRYAEEEWARSIRTAACNLHFGLDSRLANCLLGFHDRRRGGEIALTHENLSALLCVHRPSVSVSMKRLERLGIIQQRQRSFLVIDRERLKELATGFHETA